MKLVFATNNTHKLDEVRAMLNSTVELLSLQDIGCTVDIPETADSLEGNALIKAQYVFDNYGLNCFADDTGLEVEALHGDPGVYSARYAGPAHNAEANRQKLLDNLKGENNRKARFRTVMSLIINGRKFFFSGIVNGEITTIEQGENGFGYDALFVPVGYTETFAQLPAEVKNSISHRANAMKKMTDFLKNNSI